MRVLYLAARVQYVYSKTTRAFGIRLWPPVYV